MVFEVGGSAVLGALLADSEKKSLPIAHLPAAADFSSLASALTLNLSFSFVSSLTSFRKL